MQIQFQRSIKGLVELASVTLTSTASVRTDWLATVRARLGRTPLDRTLFYLTGGAAFIEFKFSQANTYARIGASKPSICIWEVWEA